MKYIKDNQNIPVALLGGGYSSDRQMPGEYICVNKGNVSYSGNSESFVDMGSSIDFETLNQVLNTDISAGLNIGVFSADMTAQYVRYVEDSTYSLSYYFYSQIELPYQLFNPTSYGKSALNSYGQGVYNSSIESFRELCGDKYIQQFQLGASLASTLKINFASQYEKSVFIEHVSASFLGIDVASSTIEKTAVQYSLNGNLELSALQVGGNAGQLAKIFNASEAGYYTTSCAINDLKACNQIIEGILSYSSSNFAKQVNFTDGVVTGDPAPIAYVLAKYTDLGLSNSSTIITPEINEARTTLAESYLNQTKALNVYNHIAESSVAKFLPYINETQVYIENLKSNLGYFDSTVDGPMSCYFTPANCTNVEQSVMSSLKPYNMSFVTDIVESKGYVYSMSWTGIALCGVLRSARECKSKSGEDSFTLIPTEIRGDYDYKEFLIKEDSTGSAKLYIYNDTYSLYINYENSDQPSNKNVCNSQAIREFPLGFFKYSTEATYASSYSQVDDYQGHLVGHSMCNILGESDCEFSYFVGKGCQSASSGICSGNPEAYACSGEIELTPIDNPI